LDTEEGRGKQRNARGSRIQTSNPGSPNGTSWHLPVGNDRALGELKHLI